MSSYSSPGDDSWTIRTEGRSPNQRLKRRRTQSNGNLTQEFGLMRDGIERGGSRFIGSGSGIHFIRTVYETLARKSGTQAQDKKTPQGNLVPGEDDQLPEGSYRNVTGNSSQLWLPGEISFDSQQNADQASFDDLVEWTRSYFENWHPLFPFLHAPAVLSIFEDINERGINSIRQSDAVIFRSILSISLADSRQSTHHIPPIPSAFVFHSIDELVSSIQFAWARPTTLENTQAAISVQLFLVSMLKLNLASRLGGLVVRMALHLGLHRCPSRFRNFTPMEAQIRRRVFWCIYCLERLLSQSLGFPLDIRDDDVDVCYPGQELHRTNFADKSNEKGPNDQLKLLTYLSKHARIRGMILELRNKSLSFRHDTLERAMPVQAELSKWANEIHDDVEEDLDDEIEVTASQASGVDKKDGAMPATHRILLLVLHHESTITLNRPLMTSNTESSASLAALQNCISSSRSIISILDKFILQNKNRDSVTESGLQIPMVWPLFTWSVWMSCFVLAYAALEGHSPISSALRYAEKTLRILKHLSLRRTSWPESCADAVEQLMLALSERSENRGLRNITGVFSVAPSHGRSRQPLDSNSLDLTSPTGRILAQESTRSGRTIQRLGNIGNMNEGANREHGTQGVRLMRSPAVAPQPAASPPHFLPQLQPDQMPPPIALDQGHDLSEINELSTEMYDQNWFDPLSAIDFSNFAPGSSDPLRGFSSYGSS